MNRAEKIAQSIKKSLYPRKGKNPQCRTTFGTVVKNGIHLQNQISIMVGTYRLPLI